MSETASGALALYSNTTSNYNTGDGGAAVPHNSNWSYNIGLSQGVGGGYYVEGTYSGQIQFSP